MASPTIRMLWGIAKSPELGMTDEELHLLVLSHTGKDSIKQLNKRELGMMVSILVDRCRIPGLTFPVLCSFGGILHACQNKRILQKDVRSGECGLAELHAVFRPDRSFEEHGGKEGKREWKRIRNC